MIKYMPDSIHQAARDSLRTAGIHATGDSDHFVHVPLEGGYHIQVLPPISRDVGWRYQVLSPEGEQAHPFTHDTFHPAEKWRQSAEPLGIRHVDELPDAVRGVMRNPAVSRNVLQWEKLRRSVTPLRDRADKSDVRPVTPLSRSVQRQLTSGWSHPDTDELAVHEYITGPYGRAPFNDRRHHDAG